MPRPVQNRKIQVPPRLKGLMPIGRYTEAEAEVILYFEEYETIRLLDYEHLTQAEASTFMEISRPTLTRIYETARNKIARALTESLPIKMEGGKDFFGDHWYSCNVCDCKFNSPLGTVCPLCQSNQIQKINSAES